MSIIHQLRVHHFREIKAFEQVFQTNFICLIGRGDAGKSTLLEAISLVLSPNWAHTFFDIDFYHSDISSPIVIEATLRNVPGLLLTEQKFGLFVCGLDEGTVRSEKLGTDLQQIPTVNGRRATHRSCLV